MTQIKEIKNKDNFNFSLFLKEEFDDLKYLSDGDTDDSDGNKSQNETQFLSNELIEEIDSFPDYDKELNKTASSLIESNNNTKQNFINSGFINNSNTNNFCFLVSNPFLNNVQMKNMNQFNNTNSCVNSLLPLISCGYEFVPKSFNKMMMNSKTYTNNQNINKKNVQNGKLHKQDWICSFCNNRNFSFRKKCNRCQARKEESETKNCK